MNITPINAAAVAPLLQVRDLRVRLADGVDVVSGISFSLKAGAILGLVGESGSGKTTIGSALLGYARPGAEIAGGSVLIDGIDILGLSPEGLRAARGDLVGHVAQDPATALNPILRIGTQLHEILEVHEPALSKKARALRISEVLVDVGLPDNAEFLRRFPHQLSGGQQQRILLALAFILKPRLIVLDEPTTALDVTTQAHILDTIRTLCQAHGIAAVYVSHDLSVVRTLVDDLIVLYAGRIVERASHRQLFAAPAHPYTIGLLSAVPDIATRKVLTPIPGHAPAPRDRPAGCGFAPRCPKATPACQEAPIPPCALSPDHEVSCLFPSAEPPIQGHVPHAAGGFAPGASLLAVKALNASYGAAPVLTDISFDLPAGRCTALVGESGSGKTTLARALTGLGQHVEGDLLFDGAVLPLNGRKRSRDQRRRIQYIFQNPYRALNPRLSIGETLCAAIHHFFVVSRAEARQRAIRALERVALPPACLDRYPRELSGGERQRIAIARALVCEPDLLICDEITSALDVSVQAVILDLLQSLQKDGLTMLFVTHDLGVVRAIADQVVVLHRGLVTEHGDTSDVLDHPQQPYTQTLIAFSRALAETSAPAMSLANV